MKAALLLFTALALASCTDDQSFSRDGANDEANVDSAAPAPTSADMGDQSRNVHFRSSTGSLPDSAHPSADRNANGQMVDEGKSRDGDPN
jgi:hypothetical protein